MPDLGPYPGLGLGTCPDLGPYPGLGPSPGPDPCLGPVGDNHEIH